MTLALRRKMCYNFMVCSIYGHCGHKCFAVPKLQERYG